MSPSPRSLQALGALVALLFLLLSLLLATRVPVVHLQWTNPAEGPGLLVAGGPASRAAVTVGQRVLSLGGVELQPDHRVVEPDTLPDWTRYRAFMSDMGALATAMRPGTTVTAVLADGPQVQLAVDTRAWYQLPALFWFQVGVGLLCFLLAHGVWVFRWSDRAALHFMISGFGVMTAACSAAVYSTRELALDGSVFRLLSIANYGGAMLFTSALLMLLWHYPTTVRPRSPWLAMYAATGLAGAAFAGQLTSGPAAFMAIILLLFAGSFISALVQWRRTRDRPLERAALGWYLLSIYIGTGLFASLSLLPAMLGAPPVVSQGLMFGVFLFMFAGIALGILRYRLFDLGRWWFRAWTWFFGGLCVLLLDLALLSLFDLSQASALSLSLALLGWVYFPLRQWLWGRRAGGREATDRDSLGRSLEVLAAAVDDEQLARRWRQVLQDEFAALEQRAAPRHGDPTTPVAIAENGLALRLPDVGAGGADLVLRLPQAGARLFGRGDVVRAEVLWRMARHVGEAMRQREQDVQSERARIMRDLHDDLGGKLLSLVYLGQGEAGHIARSALQDMRDVLSALAASPCRLSDAVLTWEAETRQRLTTLERELAWSAGGMSTEEATEGAAEVWLSARQFTNLGRILREAITNGLKHADAQRFQVVWRWADGQLSLRVEDDGRDPTGQRLPVSPPAPLPLARTIEQRVLDLGGLARCFVGEAGGIVLEVAVPVLPRAEVGRGGGSDK